MTMEHMFAQPKRAKSRTYGNRATKRQQSERDEEVGSTTREGSDDSGNTPSKGRLLPEHVDSSPPRSVRSVADKSVSHSPRTPSKRTKFSQSLSPSSAASPSPSPKVKLDLRRDVMILLSPQKDRTKRYHASATSDSQSEEGPDDGSEEDERDSQQGFVVRRPSKLSFASRMAPKRAKGQVKREATPPQPPVDGKLEARAAASPVPALYKAEAGPRSMLLSPSRRTSRKYGRGGLGNEMLRENSQRSNSNAVAKTMHSEPTMPPDTHDMNSRWDILDEMERDAEAEGGANLRSILHLRYSGEQRRFADDFDYLTMNLGRSSSQSIRQNTCMEILRSALGWEIDLDEHLHAENLPPIVAAHQTSFLINLRNTHLTARLCLLLRQAGCGEGRDVILDSAFAILCSRIFCDATVQLEDLPMVKDVVHGLGRIMSSDPYEACARTKAHESLLLRTAFDCNLAPTYCSIVTPHLVAGQVLNLLLSGSITTLAGVEASHHITELLEAITTAVWRTIEKASSQGTPPALQLEQVALLDVAFSVLRSLQNSSLRTNQIAKVVGLIRLLSNRNARAEQEGTIGYVQCLSSCLRFLVSSTQQSDESNNCHVIASDGETVQAIGELVINATRISAHRQQGNDVDGARWLDIAALALGVLTGLLERAAEQTQAAILSEPGLVENLGRLFSEQDGSMNRDQEPQARIFSGCLAVALSLLVLMDTGRGRTAFELLAKGMRREKWQDVCHSFSDCLEHFMAITKAIEQKAADVADTEEQKLHADDVVTRKEVRNLFEGEDNLVRHLILQLRTLCAEDG